MPDRDPHHDRAVRATVRDNLERETAIAAMRGEPEALFRIQLLEVVLLRRPAFQYPAIPTRKFRIDVAFPAIGKPGSGMPIYRPPIAFEVQGNVHRIKQQFYRDMERHNLLTEAGWTIYYVSGPMVRDGTGLELVKRIIGCA